MVRVDATYVKNCNIYVGDSPSSVTNQPACVSLGNPSGIPAGGSSTFNCTPWLSGRYITIMKTVQHEPITVCEVIAAGYAVLTSSVPTGTFMRTAKKFVLTTRRITLLVFTLQ
jgi:hypothetical protein